MLNAPIGIVYAEPAIRSANPFFSFANLGGMTAKQYAFR
jgi:hypothetical protein